MSTFLDVAEMLVTSYMGWLIFSNFHLFIENRFDRKIEKDSKDGTLDKFFITLMGKNEDNNNSKR